MPAPHPGDDARGDPGDDAGNGFDEAGWSALHHGIDASPVVRGWLRVITRLAGGPVRRIPPDALSVAGVVVLAAALPVAAAGSWWPAVAAVLVVAAGVLDGLDGAVALRTGRARPLGAVIDSVADRLGDVLLVGVLAVLGAPAGWAGTAVLATLLLEYLRARAQAVGMPGVGAVTVAERPTRLIVVALVAGGAGVLGPGVPLLPAGWGAAATWGGTGAVIWLGTGLIGLVQLIRGVRATIPAQYPPPAR